MRLEGDFTLQDDPIDLQNMSNLDVVPHRKVKASSLALYIEDPKFLTDKHGEKFHFVLQRSPSGTLDVKFQPVPAKELSEVEKNIKRRQNEEFRQLKERHKKELLEAKKQEAKAKQESDEALLKAEQAQFKAENDNRVARGLPQLETPKDLTAHAKAVAASREKLDAEEQKQKEADQKAAEKLTAKTGPAGAPLEKSAGAKK